MTRTKNIISICWILLLCFSANAQIYTDYIGAGNSDGIIVTSSSSYEQAQAINSLNGEGMDAKAMEASRFLGQAVLGHNMQMIDELKEDLNFEAWIDNQMNIPASNLLNQLEETWDNVLQLHIAAGEDPDDVFGPYFLHFNYAWWHMNMTNSDLLRQRVAFALSEIFVISMNSDLRDMVGAVASYYDILSRNAFGNYEDLMMEVTLHPAMGYYLSHLNNPKEDLANNIHPDENYAREIMQLFSIGLYELNPDGSRKKDGNGNDIATYDNDDIKEFAQVFTGLGPGDINDNVTWTDEPYFGLSIYGADLTVPMKMYEDFHEKDEKVLLNGFTIGANNPGMNDVEMAVNHLANHSNVGPFLALRLIQRLVKSNPSPAYISRIAEVFDNNGNGQRGDLGAVIKAILLDEEARNCEAQNYYESGKLREPVIKHIQIAKSMPLDNPDGVFWNNGYSLLMEEKQSPMFAPTVFNFFNYDHAPVGELSNAALYAPEFKIHDTTTSMRKINRIYAWHIWETPIWYSWHGDLGNQHPYLVRDQLLDIAYDPELLLNHFDIIYTHGQLSDRTRKFIREAVTPIDWDDNERLGSALYLMMISPDFSIVK